ncbi:hypothetical protein CDD80_6550 [Ophiocordyceps camponoti-rufipedis]|uniref:Uncharacterized protein n=1 Tax=Ophiocordyceps camponoti-rufipedis TaxID=2004952 RepID=A0A2C5XEQ1_9HYPO|nr:hypothetical protein CDD80_6550 [Ophiocordyceps camponoti-rufipedis]
MIVIAITTLIRVALGSIVESCICQGAWIWVSKSHQRRTNNIARLEDFKLFDEASRGFLSSVALLWRLKGMHASCIGAMIILVTHGLETLSQQMFVYVQAPTIYYNQAARPAPAPFRSDYWDNVVERGIQDSYSLALSTKSAVYSGILAAQVRYPEPQCDTANCTWPTVPTLAICGQCITTQVKVNCSSQANSYVQGRAYLSAFEILTIIQREAATKMSGASCTLWLCLKAALRGFLESLTSGTFEHASNIINFSSDWVEAMWQATGDLDVWIDALCLSLTNEFREHGRIRDPYETYYEGSASKMANYVHVKWLWMAYPILILFTSLYYLIVTVVAGAREGVSA